MPTLTPLPWHVDHWHRIHDDVLADRIPHALLLTGREGVGRHHFLMALARLLLCDSPQGGGSCGTCRSCRLYCAGTHPDYLFVAPPPDGKQITVDGIRNCLDFTSLSRHISRHQVVVIDPADAMNRSAANALLKTLEEPTPGTVFLLLTSRPAAILPTIRSRCQRLVLDQVDRDRALEWLRSANPGQANPELAYYLTGEAPLLAAAIDLPATIDRISRVIVALGTVTANPGKVMEIAEAVSGQEMAGFFEMVVRLIETMIYKNYSIPDTMQMDAVREADEILDRLDTQALFRIRGLLLQYRRSASAWSGLRERDRVEDVLLTVAQEANRRMAR